MRSDASEREIAKVHLRLDEGGFEYTTAASGGRTVIVASIDGVTSGDLAGRIRAEAGVQDVVSDDQAYLKVALGPGGKRTVIDIKGAKIGGPEIVLIAGPCSVENGTALDEIAGRIAAAGAKFLRGGAYKPSTSPYAFRGLGRRGLELMRDAANAHGLRIITEVMDPRKVAEVSEFADVLQIGSRNMQNYDLLREVGRCDRPVLLKRGLGARIKEWLLAAEHIACEGNEQIILCERGIRSFDSSTRNVLDIAAVPLVKSLTHLPVVVDPSHATGRRSLVLPTSLAAAAAGADGLMIETHSDPSSSIKDAYQTISVDEFDVLADQVMRIAQAVGRTASAASVG